MRDLARFICGICALALALPLVYLPRRLLHDVRGDVHQTVSGRRLISGPGTDYAALERRSGHTPTPDSARAISLTAPIGTLTCTSSSSVSTSITRCPFSLRM